MTPRALATIAGDRLTGRLSPPPRALSLRPGRLQARPRDRRPDPVAGGGPRRGRHRPPRRHVRGDRAVRSGRHGRAPSRAPVRAAGPAEPVRPDPRSGRPPHGLGVLPRPERFDRRHDRADPAPRSSASRRVSASGSWRSRRSAPADLEAYNPNYVGGDIAGGRFDLGQLFTRPSLRVFDPYSTPDPGIFLCSAVDAARRRRARHGGVARRPIRAPEARPALIQPGLLAGSR